MHAIEHVWRSEATCRNQFFFSTMWCLGLNSDNEAWQQESLTTGPSLSPA